MTTVTTAMAPRTRLPHIYLIKNRDRDGNSFSLYQSQSVPSRPLFGVCVCVYVSLPNCGGLLWHLLLPALRLLVVTMLLPRPQSCLLKRVIASPSKTQEWQFSVSQDRAKW
jgi:hypothetical protein